MLLPKKKMLRVSLLLLGTTLMGVAMGDTFGVSERQNTAFYIAPAEPAAETNVSPSGFETALKAEIPLENTVAQGDTVPKDGRGKIGAKNPKNFTTEVQYNPQSNDYLIIKKIGDLVVDRQYMTFEEYQNYQMEQLMQN